MPEGKDFKRVVRTRMTETGERYTEARARLRPGPSQGRPKESTAFPATVIPLRLEDFLRRQPLPRAGTEGPEPFGPELELTVEAGSWLENLEPPSVPIASIAALGTLLGGVAYVVFGLDVAIPSELTPAANAGAVPSPESQQRLFRELSLAKGELHQLLREDMNIELPALPDPRVVEGQVTGRPRSRNDGIVLPGRTRTALLLGEGGLDQVLGDRLDPSTWLSGRPLRGTLWAGFGVVLDIEKEFPLGQVPKNPSPQFTGPRRSLPEVPEAFWTAVTGAVMAAATEVALPAWPLQHASIRVSSDMLVGRHWQSPDGVRSESSA